MAIQPTVSVVLRVNGNPFMTATKVVIRENMMAVVASFGRGLNAHFGIALTRAMALLTVALRKN